jgi:hypothetical protein
LRLSGDRDRKNDFWGSSKGVISAGFQGKILYRELPPSMVPMSRSASVEIPDDLQTCQEMIRQLMEKLAEKDGKIEDLVSRMNQLLRAKFGSKAEKFDPGQLMLFAQASVQAQKEPAAEPPAAEAVVETKGHGRRRPAKELPRRRVEHKLEAAELPCPECGTMRDEIGEEISMCRRRSV